MKTSLKKCINGFLLKDQKKNRSRAPILTEKAKYFQRKLNIHESCTFSVGWLTLFKLRQATRSINVSGMNSLLICRKPMENYTCISLDFFHFYYVQNTNDNIDVYI